MSGEISILRRIFRKKVIGVTISLAVMGSFNISDIYFAKAQSINELEIEETTDNETTHSESNTSTQAHSQQADSQSKQNTNSDGASSSAKNTSKETSQTKSTTSSKKSQVQKNTQKGPGYYDIQKMSPFSYSRAVTYTQTFINSVATGAINGWKKYRILPSVSIAQAIVESGWGKSQLATIGNNLFGIKGRYQNQYVLMPTQEYVNGQYITINAEFRKYPSWSTSIEDHGNFLNINSRYSNILGVRDYRKVTQGLQDDGYATSPTYAANLNNIIEENSLTRYDDIAFKQSAFGSIDDLSVDGNGLHVKGWHVADLSYGKPYHYLFVMNAVTGKELSRIEAPTYTRNDVSSAHPNIYNSSNSAFNYEIPIKNNFKDKKVYIMSRYSDSNVGNGNFTDYRFKNNIISFENKLSIDNFKLSNGEIEVKGWHISNFAFDKPYHFLFFMDADTGKELMRVNVPTYARNDVGNTYPEIYNSKNGAFRYKAKLDNRLKGKRVYVMSRYSSDPKGNTNYLAYYAKKNIMTVPPKQNKAYIDYLNRRSNKLEVKGWHAADLAYGKPYHFLFVMNADNGKELGRVKLPTYTRNDVARAYPNIYNAQESGFKYDWPISNKFKGKRVYIMSRYSSDPKGNKDYVAYYADKNTVKISK